MDPRSTLSTLRFLGWTALVVGTIWGLYILITQAVTRTTDASGNVLTQFNPLGVSVGLLFLFMAAATWALFTFFAFIGDRLLLGYRYDQSAEEIDPDLEQKY